MEAVRRLALGLVALVGCTGLGIALWAVAAPDEKRRKEMAKVSLPGRGDPERAADFKQEKGGCCR